MKQITQIFLEGESPTLTEESGSYQIYFTAQEYTHVSQRIVKSYDAC